eukprot:gene16235-18382_t
MTKIIVVSVLFLFSCINSLHIRPFLSHRVYSIKDSVLEDASTAKAFLYDCNFLGPSLPWYSDEMVRHANLLIQSYHRLTRKELFPNSLQTSVNDPTAAAMILFHDSQRFVLSHGTQKQLPNGPILNYGNLNVLSLWRVSWEELTSMPSSYTVEAGEGRTARSKVMNQVLSESNIIRGYEGIRINKEDERFKLLNTTIWNVFEYDQKGRQTVYLGQAATFQQVDFKLEEN